MKCPRCQYANPPGSNFCLGCGTRLGATCGACGNDLPAGSRFGNKCGTPDKIRDRDDLREIREKVTGKLLTLDEALKPTLPAVLALLDVPADDAVWQGWRRPSGASARLTP